MPEVAIYKIQSGDCLLSVAAKFGLLWQTVWNHPSNAKLREIRQDPNVLLPGDLLAVPQKSIKEVTKPTEATHNFVKKGNPAKVKLRLLHEDKPRAGVSYLFKIDSDTFEGKTDSEGYVSVLIPAAARVGKLILLNKERQPAEEFDIRLGHLDPHDELIGIQQRLKNLGYECAPTGTLNDQTKTAISQFRDSYGLAQSEEIDNKLIKKLKAVHGS